MLANIFIIQKDSYFYVCTVVAKMIRTLVISAAKNGFKSVISRTVVKSTFVESKTRTIESESRPSPKRFESKSSSTLNESQNSERKK